MKTMVEMQWQIIEEGRLIPFNEFLKNSVGDGISNHYLAEDLEETLQAATAPDATWTDVIDYISPIAGAILSEAMEVDRELYVELVTTLNAAYVRLRARSTAERNADQEYVQGDAHGES
jgi:formylmethanofuran:tetrahydromethanopterin formyltransferase